MTRGSRLRLRGTVGGLEKRHVLGEGLTRIGSMGENDLVLSVRGVSRHHTELTLESDAVTIEDLSSRNGVEVNGVRVQRSLLKPGDEVGLGPIRLVLESVDADDAELGLALDATPARSGSVDTHTTDTAGAQLSTVRWVGVLEQAAERLVVTDADLGGVLGILVRELPCVAAWVLEADGRGEARVIASRGGDVGLACVDAVRRQRPPQRRGGECRAVLEQGDPLLAVGSLVDPDGRGVWLGLVGDFPGRAESASLLRTLVRLLAAHRPEPVQSGRDVGPAPDDIAFPDGYVTADSAAMARLFGEMRPLLASDLPVLILGETGAGKEPIARTLHESSPRSDGTFVAINCAAIPADMLEAELFGVAKGAATGVSEREGRFQAARGGTLLLDEIGDMPLALQAKLLRALQECEVQPVGGAPQATDVRIVASTNTDLRTRLADKTFRADLYYRIAGHTLLVPPLRERRDDIPQLVEAMVRRSAKQAERSVRGVTLRALRALVAYDWPGNVRELEHEILRLVHLCPDGDAIDFTMLPAHVVTGGSDPAAPPTPATLELEPNVARLEDALIRQALAAAEGNRTRAAKRLGLSRNGLALKMERLKIET